MALLKIKPLQTIEGAHVYYDLDATTQHQLIAIPDMNWSMLMDIKESQADVEEELMMYLFNLMDEAEAEHLAQELTLIIFNKGETL